MIAAALELIRSQGPDVTMDDVALAAGVSKPIVYRNLGDKDALVVALAEILVGRINEAIEHAMAVSPPGRQSFSAAVRATLELVDEDRHLFHFVNAGGPGTDTVQRLVEESAATMIEQFGALRRARGLDPDPARTWAYAIVGVFQMVAAMWLRDEYRSPADVAEDLADLVWPGISGR